MLRIVSKSLLICGLWLGLACSPSADNWIETKRPLNIYTISRQFAQANAGVIRGFRFDQPVIIDADTGPLLFVNNVFNGGIRVQKGDVPQRISYYNNLIRIRTGEPISLDYGDSFVDNVMVMDYSGWNPHYIIVDGGKGETLFQGNVFWFTAPSGESLAEGDGIMIFETSQGTREENHVIIERNIFLPNSTGPNGEDSLTCTAFTYACRELNSRVSVRRNTIFTHVYGGCNVGESWVTRENAVQAVKSNLFVGDVNHQGSKIRNLGNAEIDVVLAANADYNACYRCADGSWHADGAGKGYHGIEFSGSTLVGQHDLDDLDPQFVDWTRNPVTWDEILGGPGTMDSVVARIESGAEHTLQDLLEYIREGYRPQNLEYLAAGDPNDGSPDIGAVDIYTNSLMVSLPSSVSEDAGLLVDQGTLSLSTPPSSDLQVNLSSSDPTQLAVPASVMVSAGSSEIHFDLQVIQDQVADGDQTVRVWARADTYATGSDTTRILDDEEAASLSLALNLPDTLAEGSGIDYTGVVRLSSPTSTELLVSLQSSDTTELTVPKTIVIAAQQDEGEFLLEVIDDDETDGTQHLSIAATADGWQSAQASCDVFDNEESSSDPNETDNPDVSDDPMAFQGQFSCHSTNGEFEVWFVFLLVFFFVRRALHIQRLSYRFLRAARSRQAELPLNKHPRKSSDKVKIF